MEYLQSEEQENRSLFFASGDDAYDDDNDGFPNYVPKGRDPGPWVFLFTLVFTLFSTFMIPVLVILGRRWEKRRKLQKEMQMQALLQNPELGQHEGFNLEEINLGNDNHTNGDEGEGDDLKLIQKNSNKGQPSMDFSVPHSISVDASNAEGPFRNNPKNMNAPAPPRSVLSVATSAMQSAISVNTLNNMNSGVLNTIDKLMIPSYPDDDDEFRSNIYGENNDDNNNPTRKKTGTRSTLSAAVSVASQRSHLQSDLASSVAGRSVTILDAGVGSRHNRRRAHGGHLYTHTGRQRVRKQCMDDEDDEFENRSNALENRSLASHYSRGSSKRSRTLRKRRGNNAGGENSVGVVSTGEWGGDLESELGSVQRLSPKKNRIFSRKRSSSFTNHSMAKDDDTFMQHPVEDDISPNDAADADDPGRCPSFEDEDEEIHIFCGRNALWRPHVIMWGIDNLIDIAEYDGEMRRICRLAGPFIIDEVMETIFESVALALISNFIGTDAVAAYAMSELFLGMTDEFIGGISDAQSTLCPHALGAGNNYLCAQYTQIAMMLQTLLGSPFLVLWSFLIDDVVLWLGLGQHVASMAQQYTIIVSFEYLFSGITESLIGLLDITEHQQYVAFLAVVEGVVNVFVLSTFLILKDDMQLWQVGVLDFVVGNIFAAITLIYAFKMGWFKQFIPGLFKNLAIRNKPAVKNVLRTALPLAIGSFLAYSEWEVLTIFATHLGPAEVTTWAVLGTIWETFEATTEGLGEAAAVRISYHLGKGNPHMAKVSTYKCLLASTVFALFTTSIFFMLGENLAIWFFAKDATLQNLLVELIPLVGLGNITMTFGMEAWHIIGAQGRYRLATLVALVCSWFITVPLATFSVFALTINLQGVVSAVVIGYSFTGTIMACILLRSDWERLSKIIMDINAVTGETYSDDSDVEDDDEDSMSSKSSVSSSDDDSDDLSSKVSLDSESGMSKMSNSIASRSLVSAIRVS